MTNTVEDRPIQRMAVARAPILKDGVLYGPGSARALVPVDAATYLDLMAIDGIAPTLWDALDPEPIVNLPAVLAPDA